MLRWAAVGEGASIVSFLSVRTKLEHLEHLLQLVDFGLILQTLLLKLRFLTLEVLIEQLLVIDITFKLGYAV